MTSTVLAVMAATWGVVMAVSPLLQIRKIVRLGSSRDVSIGYLAVLVIGFCLWIAYGISIANPALIVPNSVALSVGLATIVVAWRYRGDLSGSQGPQERLQGGATGGSLYRPRPVLRGRRARNRGPRDS